MTAVIILFLVAGVFFFIVGVTGLLRLPDVYCRMHATTKCDTLGAGLILFGLALHMGLSAATAKLLLLVVFIWITNPTAAHVIARAAYHSNAKVSEDTLMLDETGEVQRDD